MGTPNASLPAVGYFAPNGGQLNQQPAVGQAEEVAVMTYVNGEDVWTIASSTQGNYIVDMPGQAGDIPVPGDYDWVGYDQLAVYRPSTAQFIVLQQNYSSTTGTVSYSLQTIGLGQYLSQFGLGADLSKLVPVPDQYNNASPRRPRRPRSSARPRRPSTTRSRGSISSWAPTVPIRSPGSSRATSPPRPTTWAMARTRRSSTGPAPVSSSRGPRPGR